MVTASIVGDGRKHSRELQPAEHCVAFEGRARRAVFKANSVGRGLEDVRTDNEESAAHGRCLYPLHHAGHARPVSEPQGAPIVRGVQGLGQREEREEEHPNHGSILPTIRHYGSVKATYVSLDFEPNLPPPAATTTNCLPCTANVLGVA